MNEELPENARVFAFHKPAKLLMDASPGSKMYDVVCEMRDCYYGIGNNNKSNNNNGNDNDNEIGNYNKRRQ